MNTGQEWKRIARMSDDAMYWLTEPIATLRDLCSILNIAEQNMAVHGFPTIALMFRGQATSSPLAPRSLSERVDIDDLGQALREMIAVCKEALGGSYSDSRVYFIMRHAGIASHLIDWSCNWKVALWFALHNADGSLTERSSSLWALRHLASDIRSTFFPIDQHVCERSEKQEGWAYSIRFANVGDGVRVLPMECDELYRGRLLRIPIDKEAHKRLETELLADCPEVGNVMSVPSPLPDDIIEKCNAIFARKLCS